MVPIRGEAIVDLSRLWTNGMALSSDADSASGRIHHVAVSGSDVPVFDSTVEHRVETGRRMYHMAEVDAREAKVQSSRPQ